ncbi:hypothetical protein GGR54DRAFT_627110 [Hypoxylon sp. NC1633]|nr:hypothetical protein GGR54DRAFT_627110 [Hypoxylon sp. NC1633]
MLESSAAAGGNSKAIPPSDGPLFVVLINPGWDAAGDDERIFAAVDGFVIRALRTVSAKACITAIFLTLGIFDQETL